MHVDDKIILLLKRQSMTAREVAEALDINIVRASVRLRSLRKHQMVTFKEHVSNSRGINPLKYRLKKN